MRKNIIINSLALIGVGVATGVVIKKVNKYFNKVEKMPEKEKMEKVSSILPQVQVLLILAALWTIDNRVTSIAKMSMLNTMGIIDNADISVEEKLECFKRVRSSLHYKDIIKIADEYITSYMEVE